MCFSPQGANSNPNYTDAFLSRLTSLLDALPSIAPSSTAPSPAVSSAPVSSSAVASSTIPSSTTSCRTATTRAVLRRAIQTLLSLEEPELSDLPASSSSSSSSGDSAALSQLARREAEVHELLAVLALAADREEGQSASSPRAAAVGQGAHASSRLMVRLYRYR